MIDAVTVAEVVELAELDDDVGADTVAHDVADMEPVALALLAVV
jgi:hypothetical protein